MLRFLILTLLFFASSGQTLAAENPLFTFDADAKQAGIARNGAEAFVKMAHEMYSMDLDYTDASIRQVEYIAGDLNSLWHVRAPNEHAILNMSYAIGFYIGETYIRHHGGEWGVATQRDGQKVSALRQSDGALVFPTSKAEKRLRNGSEDNLFVYYQILLQKSG